ncbi:hypothetical protein HY522_05825 [bacterium]|nr:hypothetical protein [bacterium]
MASEHEEIDPIKSNPDSHKAIGVALMILVLVGLSYALTRNGALAGALGSQTLDLITPDFRHVSAEYDPKHTPKIDCPDTVKAGEWFDVTVTIGAGAIHPSLVEHHVRWIAIYKDDVELSRVYLHPVQSYPRVTFTIALEDSCDLIAMEEPTHAAPRKSSKRITVVKPN